MLFPPRLAGVSKGRETPTSVPFMEPKPMPSSQHDKSQSINAVNSSFMAGMAKFESATHLAMTPSHHAGE